MHIVMGTVMAAMVLDVGNVGSSRAWEVVFVGFAGWFLWRAIQMTRASSSTWHALHESNHVVTSSAMVAMFTGGMVMHGGSMAGMAGMSGMAAQPSWLAPAALFFAVALAGYGIWNVTLMLATRSPAPFVHLVSANSGAVVREAAPTSSQASVTAPRLTLCCDVAMAISMVYMFAWVH
ncbi:MAG: DUF5134 domain-containing protein [Acidimicrobiales bacterium]